MPMRIGICDTETATLKGPICDFAFIEIDENLDIISTTESLIDPLVPIAPAAQAVHGITQVMVADAPSAAEYLAHFPNPFAAPAGTDLVLWGHNVQFDARMLTEAQFLPPTYTKACTLRIVKNLWPDIDTDRENYKLGTLAVMFGLETGPAHRAMGDCVTCLNLLRYIADYSKVNSFEELLALGTKALSPESKLGFGNKHRDDKIKDVPISYINWMLKNVTDLDPDIRAAITARLQ